MQQQNWQKLLVSTKKRWPLLPRQPTFRGGMGRWNAFKW
jgi:hypothetical protein